MREWGIWSNFDGGFVETQLWSEAEAMARLPEYSEDDPEVLEICPDHEEQPLMGCEEC